jgi:hypothetical protein
MTYANAFNPDFCLLLRERRATSLAHMQDAALEVESNILAADKLRGKADRDREKVGLKPRLLVPLLPPLKQMK